MPVKAAPLALTVIGALCVVGIIFLTATGHQPPAVLDYLATASVAALAGALLPSQPPPASTGPAPSSPAPTRPAVVAAAVPGSPVQLVSSQQPATAAVNSPAPIAPATAA